MRRCWPIQDTERLNIVEATPRTEPCWIRGSVIARLRVHLPAEVDFKIHRTRNTAITNWLRAGTDLYTTMHLAGHKSPKVTERYAGGFSDEELARLARPAFSMIYGKKAS